MKSSEVNAHSLGSGARFIRIQVSVSSAPAETETGGAAAAANWILAPAGPLTSELRFHPAEFVRGQLSPARGQRLDSIVDSSGPTKCHKRRLIHHSKCNGNKQQT